MAQSPKGDDFHSQSKSNAGSKFRWHHAGMRGERGLSNGVQLTLLFPLAFSVLLLTLQWALATWASATALAAAQDAARAAAAHQASGTTAHQIGMDAADNGSLTDVGVAVDQGPVQTKVTVTGRAVSVIPGWDPVITETSRRPTERLTRA